MKEKSCIMVIDDDRTNLCMTEEVLVEYYDVMLVLSGIEALEILRSGVTPDLILLDIDMPEMNGYETFEHICDIESLSGVPVIFLTGLTGSEAELTGLSLGAQDYISKPFVRENLLARINLRLKAGKQVRQLKMFQELFQSAGIDEDKLNAVTKKLRPVEQEVARLIALGFNNYEIAKQLNYTHGYVKNLIIFIYDKLRIHSRGELREMVRVQDVIEA